MSTLISLARVCERNKILDVGCGPGVSTRLLAHDVPAYDSVIYGVDFSENMIKLCEKEFNEFTDFKSNNNNFCTVDFNLRNGINIQNDVKEIRAKKVGKIIKFIRGDMNALPFVDEQFEVYLSNLSLQISPDFEKTVREAFRVLLPGGVAAFATWGRKENSKFSCFFSENLAKFKINSAPLKNYYQKYDNERIREIFKNVGFKNIKIEYTTMIFDVYDVIDYLEKYQNSYINEILKNEKDEKKVKEYLEDLKDQIQKEIIDKDNLPTLEIQIILAFK